MVGKPEGTNAVLKQSIHLNGSPFEPTQLPCSLADLIALLGLDQSKIAVEINHSIIPKSQYQTHQIVVHDQVEIIQAIGGG